jgi:hypothetical protein
VTGRRRRLLDRARVRRPRRRRRRARGRGGDAGRRRRPLVRRRIGLGASLRTRPSRGSSSTRARRPGGRRGLPPTASRTGSRPDRGRRPRRRAPAFFRRSSGCPSRSSTRTGEPGLAGPGRGRPHSLREIRAEGSPAASLHALGGRRDPVLQLLGGDSAPPFREATAGLDERLANGPRRRHPGRPPRRPSHPRRGARRCGACVPRRPRPDVIIRHPGAWRKRYGRTDALVDLTMRVEPGEVFGFLGPNGAGKTTAVKLLLGLARPAAARHGPRRARSATASRVGGSATSPSCSATSRGSGPRGPRAPRPAGRRASTGRRPRLDPILDEVGLLDRAAILSGGFSKGMQQRLGLGVALLGSPALVILDEPTSGARPGRPGRRPGDHPPGPRRRHDRLPDSPPSDRGRARLRPRRDRRPRPRPRERPPRRPLGEGSVRIRATDLPPTPARTGEIRPARPDRRRGLAQIAGVAPRGDPGRRRGDRRRRRPGPRRRPSAGRRSRIAISS